MHLIKYELYHNFGRMMLSNRIFIFLLGIAILSVTGCATKGSPGGGPVDRTPPEVVSTFPATDSTGVARGIQTIDIEFSERMNEGSLTNAIFISPPLDYTIKWKRSRKLELQLSDTLWADQTYVISIAAEASDERNNKMVQSYQFAFSSGDIIDRGIIAGRVLDTRREETVLIFAFAVSDTGTAPDPTIKKPGYISQTGQDGIFFLNFLKPARYRVFAIQDQNRNLRLDANFERVGIPYRDVTIDSVNMKFDGLLFRLTKLDTIAPFITGVRPVNDTYLQLRLSEPIRINDRTSFHVVNQQSTDTLQILGMSRNRETENIIDVFTTTMPQETEYQFISTFMEDTSGVRNDTLQAVLFQSRSITDTTRLELLEFTPADSARAVRPEQTISLKFSVPMLWESVFTRFQLVDSDSIEVPGEWQIQSVYEAGFIPEQVFIPDSSYRAVLSLEGVEDLWTRSGPDSLISRYFTIISSRELGEISGTIQTADTVNAAVFLSLHQLDRKGKPLRLQLAEPGEFLFLHVPEGQFLLRGFWDLDGDGHYSFGDLFPFSYSEPFFVHPDTIKVRKRWETRGIPIQLPEVDIER